MASTIPNGVQQFLDNNGNPLVGGRVHFYIPGTTVNKNTYQDPDLTILNTNPIILNARGEATIWGNGRYRQVVYDQWGNLVWDRIAQSSGADPNSAATDALKEQLADPNDPDNGAGMIPTVSRNVMSVPIIRSLPKSGNPWVMAAGYHAAGDGGGGLYYLDPSDTTSDDDGGAVIVAADGGRWKLNHNGRVNARQFGAIPDGETNSAAAIKSMAEFSTAAEIIWEIPDGQYYLAGDADIVFTTSGNCHGKLLIYRASKIRISFNRDSASTPVDISSWGALVRGAIDVGAENAAGKNLYFESSEILIEGKDSPAYTKQEMIRCGNNGEFTTALVCSYTNRSLLVVHAYEPSSPITVNGLSIEIVGTGQKGDDNDFVNISRDNVTLNDLQIINKTAALPVAISVFRCSDVSINKPVINGFDYDGLGYGVLAAGTIGLSVIDAYITDCRHSYTGRHNVDVMLDRGEYSVVDDHWVDRFIARDIIVRAPTGGTGFGFAGNDITLIRPKQYGGRSLCVIRDDTPNLGGNVIIDSPSVINETDSGNFYLFGFSSPDAVSFTGPFTHPPSLPDIVEITSPNFLTVANQLCVWIGEFNAQHTPIGEIILQGAAKVSSVHTAVLYTKDGENQINRSTALRFNGYSPTRAVDYVSFHAISKDPGAVRAINVSASGSDMGIFRASDSACDSVFISGGSANGFQNEAYPIPSQLRIIYSGTEMRGGSIPGDSRAIAFLGCAFIGEYTDFPSANSTMVGNVATVTTNLPSEIRNKVELPFN